MNRIVPWDDRSTRVLGRWFEPANETTSLSNTDPSRTRFTANDQAAGLRALIHPRRKSADFIAVLSGKGGVGKTNLAVNLAVCLAGRGLRVALVDLDLGLANADLLLNLHPRLNLAHVIAGSHTLDDVCATGPADLRFIGGASGFHGLANLSELERQHLLMQLQKLETSTDIVVFDCAAGLAKNVLSFALAADRIVVVTTPEPTSLADAYASIKALARERCTAPISLFVNRVDNRADAQSASDRVRGVAKRFLNYSVADGGYMLQDTAVELAVRARCPFVIRFPNSNAAACVNAFADELVNGHDRQQRTGFLRRVAGLFA